MTFTEWQKTARYSHMDPPGLIYYGGLFIERIDHHLGTWMLVIGNHNEASNDLAKLEQTLYLWGLENGHFEETDKVDLKCVP